MSTAFDLTPATAQGAEPRGGSSAKRLIGLARANALLLVRNRMTLSYALLLPLFPIALLAAGTRGDETAGITAISSVLMLGVLFPVYYNLLSLTVTRRDELVLKRLRTGEATDREILASMALPGVAVYVGISIVASIAVLGFGQSLPTNPLIALVTVLVSALTLVGFAFWTAAWTRNAEAAQLTSMPIVLLMVIGNLRALFPERVQQFVDLTPGAALDALVRIGWFGQDRDGASLGFADQIVAAGQPLAVLIAWTVLALVLVQRSMRWEPRG